MTVSWRYDSDELLSVHLRARRVIAPGDVPFFPGLTSDFCPSCIYFVDGLSKGFLNVVDVVHIKSALEHPFLGRDVDSRM